MAPFAPHPFPGPGRGRRVAAARLALALAGSAGMHAWLAGWPALDLPRPVVARPADGWLLEARLEKPARPVAAQAAGPDAPAEPAPRARPTEIEQPGRRAPAHEIPLAAAERRPTLPAAVDPNYYDARDLDVYPRPVTPLDLPRLADGHYRFRLLIDQAGRVTSVEGEHAQQALQAALAATRFHPARRDGRAVRSRIELEIGPARAGDSR